MRSCDRELEATHSRGCGAPPGAATRCSAERCFRSRSSSVLVAVVGGVLSLVSLIFRSRASAASCSGSSLRRARASAIVWSMSYLLSVFARAPRSFLSSRCRCWCRSSWRRHAARAPRSPAMRWGLSRGPACCSRSRLSTPSSALPSFQRPSSDRDHHPARKYVAAHPSLARHRCRRVVRRGERDGALLGAHRCGPGQRLPDHVRARSDRLARVPRLSGRLSRIGGLALEKAAIFDAIAVFVC